MCEILPDVEEWGQIILIGILLRYVIARHGLIKESIMFSLCQEKDCGSEKTVSVDYEPDFLWICWCSHLHLRKAPRSYVDMDAVYEALQQASQYESRHAWDQAAANAYDDDTYSPMQFEPAIERFEVGGDDVIDGSWSPAVIDNQDFFLSDFGKQFRVLTIGHLFDHS